MKCMFCSQMESKVVDSRPTDDNLAIRRRRECVACGKRFTTYEKIETPMVLVVKKDGKREAFSLDKIRYGIVKACEKRPVSAMEIEAVVADMEGAVYNRLGQEITTHEIGEMLMEKLRDLDQVAYVRFASVYRQFRDLTSFRDEIEKLFKD